MPLENEDPKKKAGELKDPLHLLPTVAMRKTAHVLALGARKYGVYNWRYSDGIKASTYVAAIMRHLTQFMDGEIVADESGISHLAHIMATCSILLDAEHAGHLIDDREKEPMFCEYRCGNCDATHMAYTVCGSPFCPECDTGKFLFRVDG